MVRIVCNIVNALADVVKLAKSGFSESVDVVFVLDQQFVKQGVKGCIDLPSGLGREVRIVVFAKEENVSELLGAGADAVGGEELIERVSAGDKFDYDWCLATPDLMPVVSRLAKVLGPRGLMPNPKMGTVGASLGGLVKKIKLGRVRFKSDAGGLIHIKIGNVKFSSDELLNNLKECLSVLADVQVDGKAISITRAYLSTTMSLGSIELKLN